MSYRSSSVQEAYGNAGSNRAVRQPENFDDGSQVKGSTGSQKGGSGEATTAYHGEDSGAAYGSSSQTNRQGGYVNSGSVRDGVSGSSSTARHRVGFEDHSSGQTGTGLGASSSRNVSGKQPAGSSTAHTGNSTTGSSSSYGSSSGGHTGSTSGGYRVSSGGNAGGSSGGYGGSSTGYTSGSSGQRGGTSGSSGNVSRSGTGNFSGGYSSRSTGGYSSRSSGGRPGFSSGHCGVSGNGGFGGFSAGNATSGQRGGFNTGGFSNGGEGLLQTGKKETMQNLNSRLSAYMDKVRDLEDSNSELENKIKTWYETHQPKKVDNSNYYKTIENLKDQIINSTLDNNQLTVEVDNARLATDDFRVKFESELSMRQSVEVDIEGLRKVLDDLTLEKASLESQIENLREEIAASKKMHEEEMKALQGQTSDVNVQVDAAPGINMLKVLNEMRAQYEELAEDYRKTAEKEYNQKITELSNEISCSSAEIETGKSEATELRRTMQTLEIELQSLLAMKCSLENTLAETQGRYSCHLSHIQEKVSKLEDQLAQVRCDMENQSYEYKILLDIKTRLENEIEMYRQLLDGENVSSGGSSRRSGGMSRNTSVSGSGNGSVNVSGNSSSYSSTSVSGSASGSGMTSGSASGSVSGSSNAAGSSRRSDSSSVTDPKKNRLVTTITEERVDGRLVSTKVDKIEQKA
ncbi:unnamed protein product [Ranitomeya imitator]|uniref:IF rod domain-containing protein n=1 Tax=Ranitomeya imitator TaxID=111125 RepID=A0ABN9MLT9_9NEOB|nr:unnamed protein product [Ranitomeya imitator]